MFPEHKGDIIYGANIGGGTESDEAAVWLLVSGSLSQWESADIAVLCKYS